MENGYILEKAAYTLQSLAHLAESLKDKTLDLTQLRDRVAYDLGHALCHLTKVASSLTRTKWDVTDGSLILSDPQDGLETLLVRYGWLTETAKQREKARLEAFLEAAASLLNNPARAPARTLLNELIVTAGVKNRVMDHMLTELEKVHMGERDWNDFRLEASQWLTDLAPALNQSSDSTSAVV